MITAYRASHDGGRIAPGEYDKWYIPNGWRYDGSKRVVIWLHGAGGDYRIGPVERWLVQRARAPWICASLGGPTTWAGDTVRARITAAWQWAIANLGVAEDKCVLWGGSMGGANALDYALVNPQNVAALGAAIPALDPEFVRLGNVGGFKTSIEAIYGANPVPASRQVKLRGGEWDGTVAAKIWAATDDPYTPFASTQQFVADSGVDFTSLGIVGHSYVSLYQQQEPLDLLRAHV